MSADGRLGCASSAMTDAGRGLVMSPDGKHAYATSTNGEFGEITVFTRNPATGALTPTSCVSQNGSSAGGPLKKCADASGLSLVNDIAISADGSTVYTVSFAGYEGGDAVSVFRRDAQTGALSQLQCLTAIEAAGCTAGALQEPYAVAVVGNTLVTAGESLSTFPLNADGTIEGPGTCVTTLSKKPELTCAGAPRNDQLRPIDALATGGSTVYGTASHKSQLTAFGSDGALQACRGYNCEDARGLAGAADIVADAAGVYVGADDFVETDEEDGSGYSRNGAVSVFAPDGLAQATGPAGCLLYVGKTNPGCAAFPAAHKPGFGGVTAIGLSPNGRFVLAAFGNRNAVYLLKRDPTSQALTPATGKQGCLAPKGKRKCGVVHGMDYARHVTFSPDSRYAYVLTYEGIVVLRVKG